MSVRKRDGRWEVRWYVGGRGSPRRQRTFDRKTDADVFEREVNRRKQLGELALLEQRHRTVRELAREWWAKYALPNLADWTISKYQRMLVSHIEPRLGAMRVGEVTPEVIADFRAKLEKSGVGRDSVRVSLVVLQAMFAQAERWGWLQANPVKAVAKPSGQRRAGSRVPRPLSGRGHTRSAAGEQQALRGDTPLTGRLPKPVLGLRSSTYGATRSWSSNAIWGPTGGGPEGARLPPPSSRSG